MTAVAISTNFATRPRYHREITSGVKAKSEDVVFFGEPFKNVPHKLNAKYGEFPMTKRGDPDLQALRELISEGVAGLDEETLQKAVTLAFADGEIQLKTRSIKDIQQSVPKTPDLTLVKDKIGRGDQLNNAERSEVIKLGFRIWKTYNPSITNYMIMRAAKKTYARQAKPNVGQFASRFSSTWVTSGNATQWMVRTHREESAAKPLVNKIFD